MCCFITFFTLLWLYLCFSNETNERYDNNEGYIGNEWQVGIYVPKFEKYEKLP